MPKLLSLGRQFEQINFGAFGVFVADLSAPILVQWVPCPKYLFEIGIDNNLGIQYPFQGRSLSEIFKEDINIDGILIAPKNEELAKCVPFSIISPIFILQQGNSLRGIVNCSDVARSMV